MARRELTDAQRAEYAEQRRAELEQAQAQIVAKAAELVDGPQWQRWLQVASKFHRYSFNNTVMILLQRPDATHIAGYKAWQQNFDRNVNKGEKGIRVLAPVTRRVERLDAQGKPVLDDKGKPIKDVRMVGAKLVSVFDVSQTSGTPLPEKPAPQLLAGQAPDGLWDRLAERVAAEGFTLHRGDCDGANGVTNYTDRTVTVRADVDDAQAVKTLAHELGHVLLHEPAARDNDPQPPCRGRYEVEAESVAYLVTAAHGLDAGQYTFTYVAGWAERAQQDGQELHEVIAHTASRVIDASHRILEHTQPPGDQTPTDAQARRQERAEERHAGLADTPAVSRLDRVAALTESLSQARTAAVHHDPDAYRPAHTPTAGRTLTP